MRAIRILIADDHTLFRDGMRRILGSDPALAVVGMAGSGESAVEAAADCAPDVILMDVDMPGGGGIAAMKTILARRPACRVLLLTGHKDYAVAGLRAGARGYVLKEAEVEDIIAAIHSVYGGGVALHPHIQAAVVEGLRQGAPDAPPAPAPSEPAGPEPAPLSARENEVLGLVARGLTNAQIAERLMISPHTVHAHVRTIYGKLGLNSRAEAVRYAIVHGIR